MTYFAGLDVSVKETSVCVVDDAGKIVREARVASEPEALLQVLTNSLYRFKRVGLERPDRCRSGVTAVSPKRACR
jgi:transposase